MPRPKIYANKAEKQRAYRYRKGAALGKPFPRPSLRSEIEKLRSAESNVRKILDSKGKGVKRLKKIAKWSIKRFVAELYFTGVLDSITPVGITFAMQPFQWEFLESFLNFEIKFLLALCTRRGSKTFLCAIAICFLLLKQKIRIGIISGSADQLMQLREYITFILAEFENCIEKDNELYKYFYNGSKLYVLASTIKGARSRGVDILVIDEAVLVEELVLKSALSMKGDSTIACVRALTTPLLSGENKIIKQKYDVAISKPSLRMKVFAWTWKQCPWINKEEVEAERAVMSFDEFQAEWEGKWGTRMGKTYILNQIDRVLMRRDQLLSVIQNMQEHHRPLIHRCGIDFGVIHPTVALKGFIAEGINAEGHPDDVLYFYAMKIWNADQNKYMDNVLKEIVEFVRSDNADCYSEDSENAKSENNRLEPVLRGYSLKLVRQLFKKEKEQYVQAMNSRLNHQTCRIVDDLYEFIQQLRDSERDKNGDVKKTEGIVDDCHDAGLHLTHAFEDIDNEAKWKLMLDYL